MNTFYKIARCLVVMLLCGTVSALIAFGEYYTGIPAIYFLIPNMFVGFGIGIMCVIWCIKIIEE